MVDTPGTYIVQVAASVTDKFFIADDHPRYVVPLRVVTASGLMDILRLLPDESERVPFSEVAKYFLKGVIWEGDVMEDELPIKGEKVVANFDYVDEKLTCTRIELLPREHLEYLNLTDLTEFRKTLSGLM